MSSSKQKLSERARSWTEEAKNTLCNVAQLMDAWKHDAPGDWTDWDQLQRDQISALLSSDETPAEPDEFQKFLDGWMQAYPLDMFPLPDFVRAHDVLKEDGISLDCISAANFRHVLLRVSNRYAEKAEAPRETRRVVIDSAMGAYLFPVEEEVELCRHMYIPVSSGNDDCSACGKPRRDCSALKTNREPAPSPIYVEALCLELRLAADDPELTDYQRRLYAKALAEINRTSPVPGLPSRAEPAIPPAQPGAGEVASRCVVCDGMPPKDFACMGCGEGG